MREGGKKRGRRERLAQQVKKTFYNQINLFHKIVNMAVGFSSIAVGQETPIL
jgi:hypothetical protein